MFSPSDFEPEYFGRQHTKSLSETFGLTRGIYSIIEENPKKYNQPFFCVRRHSTVVDYKTWSLLQLTEKRELPHLMVDVGYGSLSKN